MALTPNPSDQFEPTAPGDVAHQGDHDQLHPLLQPVLDAVSGTMFRRAAGGVLEAMTPTVARGHIAAEPAHFVAGTNPNGWTASTPITDYPDAKRTRFVVTDAAGWPANGWVEIDRTGTANRGRRKHYTAGSNTLRWAAWNNSVSVMDWEPWTVAATQEALDRIDTGTTHSLRLPGLTTDYISTPDHASLRITGDIDIRARIKRPDWTANPPATTPLVARWVGSSNQRSYALSLASNNQLRFEWSTDGTLANVQSVNLPNIPNPGPDEPQWLRATLDVDDAGVWRVRMYASTRTDPTEDDWTSLNLNGVAGAAITSVHPGTAPLTVGLRSTAEPLSFVAAQVRNGIGGTRVADLDLSAPVADDTATDAVGKVWSLLGANLLWEHRGSRWPHVRPQDRSEKGQPDGYASLGATGVVPASELPPGAADVGPAATILRRQRDWYYTSVPSASQVVWGAALGALGSKWRGMRRSSIDGRIYCCPFRSGSVLIIDPSDDTWVIEDYGLALPDSGTKWYGIEEGPDGKLYCSPFHESRVLVIDPATNTASLTDFGIPNLGDYAHVGIIRGADGKLYCVPDIGEHILVIDPMNGTASLEDFGLDLSDGGTFAAPNPRWTGGAMGNNGVIYAPPRNATDILQIDTVNGTAVRNDMGQALASGANKWRSAGLGADGRIYCPPNSGGTVLIIDPDAGSASLNDYGLDLSGLSRYRGIRSGPDGRLWATPYDGTQFLIIDPIAQTAKLDALGASFTDGANQYVGMDQAGSRLFFCPSSAEDVLIVDIPAAPPLPDVLTRSGRLGGSP